MQKILIKLNEEKVKWAGEYDILELWRCIDEMFLLHGCTIEKQPDGAHLYLGDEREPEQQFAKVGNCCYYLMKKEWFASAVEKWLWYEGDRAPSDNIEVALRRSEVFQNAYLNSQRDFEEWKSA